MDLDIELNNIGLNQIINFQSSVGDCLFDTMKYLVKYSIISDLKKNLFKTMVGI
jgi:hypothetical protein